MLSKSIPTDTCFKRKLYGLIEIPINLNGEYLIEKWKETMKQNLDDKAIKAFLS